MSGRAKVTKLDGVQLLYHGVTLGKSPSCHLLPLDIEDRAGPPPSYRLILARFLPTFLKVNNRNYSLMSGLILLRKGCGRYHFKQVKATNQDFNHVTRAAA